MITLLIVAVALLWLVNIALILVVSALARQIGVLHERVAPIGALSMDRGPKVGDPAPSFTLPSLSGGQWTIGASAARSQMLFFLSPSCPVCKKLLPILRSLATAERDRLEIVLASDGAVAEHRAFYDAQQLSPFPYLLSADLGMAFQVPRLPYAVLIGPSGRISAKGLINNREQLEGLLAAQELGVASLQDYAAKTRNHPVAAAALK